MGRDSDVFASSSFVRHRLSTVGAHEIGESGPTLVRIGILAQAEDLVQEVCVGVARRGGPWREAYVLRAVRNRFYDGLRRRLLPFPILRRRTGRTTPLCFRFGCNPS